MENKKEISLFINLTSEESARVKMALHFGMKQLLIGHPVVIFLNGKSVLACSTSNSELYADQQKAMGALIGKGAVLYVCPMGMKNYGVQELDLIPGLQLGNADLINQNLMKPNTQSLSW
jgi:predicted peroxiredoxin